MNYLTKRRTVVLFIAISLILSLFVGCAKNEGQGNGVFINAKYADSGMLTINKEAFDYEKGIILNAGGFGLQLPQVMHELSYSGNLQVIGSEYTANLLYLTEKAQEIIKKGANQEEAEALGKNIFQCFAVSRIRSNDENAELELQRIKSNFSNIDTIAAAGDDTYYFAYNEDYSALTLLDADKANIDKVLSEREALKNYICLFSAEVKNMNDFDAKTFDGNTFTQEDLSKYDLTMVNVWATWCGPCVEEMPELQQLYGMLPDNANMITICADANEEPELANRIIKELKCTFKVLVPDEKLQKSLLEKLTGYPTTIFVDRDGNMVGEPQIGVPGRKENVAKAYLQMIEERLNMVVSSE